MTYRADLTVFADYFQFYLEDGHRDYDELTEGWCDWTPQNLANRVIAVPGLLNIATARNMRVPVHVELCASEPETDVDQWDHIVETGINIQSGTLVITEMGTDDLIVKVSPGYYRVRICFAGLDTLSADGLEGEDTYRIALWPGSPIELAVVKRAPPS